jgi:hypothetical protein
VFLTQTNHMLVTSRHAKIHDLLAAKLFWQMMRVSHQSHACTAGFIANDACWPVKQRYNAAGLQELRK